MRSLIFAAILSLAVVPAAFAKSPCLDAYGKIVKCRPPTNPLHHPICVDSKPCGNLCIPRYKICHQ